jgi:exopolyphosphatase/guanosine-5'-triphosphate,3'-diphosphate pyrophosphatase
MHTNRISVIDLGTNTFNLLVAEYSEEGTSEILHRSKYPTKIGKGGINQNTITDEAIQRAKNAFDEMTHISDELNATKRIAFATSAIRTASNGDDFVKMIEDNYQVSIDIISGDREAELIYSGTKHAVELNHEKLAILDIGGGSNEIIIANNEGIFWKKSYPLGMTRLLERFMPSEPISKEEIKQVEEYLKEQLTDLYQALEVHSVKTLIGSSGSFDTFKQVLLAEKINTNGDDKATQFEIKLKDFFRLHQNFLGTTLAERKEIPGMDPVRVELIVIASIFINHLVKEAGFSKLYQSSYALKEGALFEHIDTSINTTVEPTVEVKE